ncbi:MAG TPA: TolC family protein [Bacteroidota bacterium]|nr:TolC family protein [Bacteroidota bacterium]
MRSRIVLLGVFLAASAPAALAQQIDTLTLEKAVSLAIQHQPSLRGSEAAVREAEAFARQAISAFYPAVAFNASDTRNGGTTLLAPTISPGHLTYSSYTAAFQGNLTLWDFGKTSGRVSQNDYLADAASGDYAAAREVLALNTEVAYFAYLEARRVVVVNELALSTAASHLKQAQAFYSVGRRPQLDVTKAEVDSLNANVNLIQARNAFRVAKLNLENAMGVHPANDYPVSDSVEVPTTYTTLDSARRCALSNRPEVIAARARLDAGRAAVAAAWGGHLPTVAAFGAYSWNNFNIPPLFSRWSAGLSFTLPIFQGFSLAAQVQEAEAAQDIAQSNLEVLQESVMLDVEQQWLAVREAAERAIATAKLVQEAQENLTLVERQYAAGVATALDESDAQLTLSNARITDIQAQFDYRTSFVRLRRAMGLTVIPAEPAQ